MAQEKAKAAATINQDRFEKWALTKVGWTFFVGAVETGHNPLQYANERLAAVGRMELPEGVEIDPEFETYSPEARRAYIDEKSSFRVDVGQTSSV